MRKVFKHLDRMNGNSRRIYMKTTGWAKRKNTSDGSFEAYYFNTSARRLGKKVFLKAK